MDNSIDQLQEETQLSLITDMPQQVKEIELYFHGLTLKWNGMDYIHLLTQVQKLNVAATICPNEDIKQATQRIEALLNKYEYDIPATASDMQELNRLIACLKIC